MPESIKRIRDHKKASVRVTASAIVAAACVIFAYGLVTFTYNVAAMAGVVAKVSTMSADMLVTLSLLWAISTTYLMVPKRKRGTGGDTAAARVRS